MINRLGLFAVLIMMVSAFNTSTAETDNTANFTLEKGENLPRSANAETYHKEIQSILGSDDFAQKRSVTRWRWIDTQDKKARDEKFPELIIDFLELLESNQGAIRSIASILEVFLWILLGSVLIYLVYNYHENIRDLFHGRLNREPEPELPATLLGLDLKKQSLPTDVATSARQLWDRGEHREAVALLLRASLIFLIKEHRIKLYDSDTEAECCQRIEAHAAAEVSAYMNRLVAVWQCIAYAHRTPDSAQFAALCQHWPSLFRATGTPDSGVVYAN